MGKSPINSGKGGGHSGKARIFLNPKNGWGNQSMQRILRGVGGQDGKEVFYHDKRMTLQKTFEREGCKSGMRGNGVTRNKTAGWGGTLGK